jgi:hypothetical protein
MMEIALVILAVAALALAGWSIWLLQRHWPKPDWLVAKEAMILIFSAYRKGRDAVPVNEALESMAAELAVARQREFMSRQADTFMADRVVPDREDMEAAETVAEMGNNVQ